jgi:hypothetical protein
LIPLLIVAALNGDNVNYFIGRTVGPRVFHQGNRFFKQEYLHRTHDFYARHGGKTLVLARFVPIVRTFAPFVAGIGRMRYARFLCFSIAGAVLWVCLFALLGYLLRRPSGGEGEFLDRRACDHRVVIDADADRNIESAATVSAPTASAPIGAQRVQSSRFISELTMEVLS